MYRVNIDAPDSSIRFVSKEFNTKYAARGYFNDMLDIVKYSGCIIFLYADDHLIERKVIGDNGYVLNPHQR